MSRRADRDPTGRGGTPDGSGPTGSEATRDAELSATLAAARAGDDEAFRTLYRVLQPLLLRYLRALVGADAEDVASETWLQIVRDLSSFEGDYDRFRGWAATIARHRALDHVRYTRRRPSIAVPAEEFGALPDGSDAAGLALEAVSTRASIELIATLPRDQAEAVLLRVVMGLDVAATARVLGKRAGAVRTAAYRGLRRLAERLDRSGQSAEGSGGSGATGPAGPDSTRTVTPAPDLTLRDMR
ncbi:RNA polymerase sigma factor [Micromonospora sp. NPDC049559]|uniref:RNA polymerase sigma factor n=1 Tax=Micromonospora sp. NPDC049559 TaxID=3155923 RepID=UPI003433BB75